MELFKRWKKDAKFRQMVILGLVIFYFVSSSSDFKIGAQAMTNQQCLAINGEFMSSYNECIGRGCFAQVDESGNWPLFLDDIATCTGNLLSLNIADYCVAAAENGKYVLDAGDLACKSGKSIKQGNLCNHVVYQCVEGDPAEACKTWQKPIAKILEGFWKNSGMGCSTKAYIVIGAGVLLLMAVI